MFGSRRRRGGPPPLVLLRTLVGVLLLGSVGLAQPGPVAADAPAIATVAYDSPLLAMPSEGADVLAEVPVGTEVILTGSTAIGFLQVTVDDQTGWVAAPSLAISNRIGIPLAEAAGETQILVAPMPGADVLGAIPAGGVAILTGAEVGQYVAASYDGVGGWVAESDLGLPYDADETAW